MKPLRLVMQAFGPFPNRQVIDFTALGKHPLFLINGPTGAGKTTLLDAISYALFGKTTGDERQGDQMRCHHARPQTATEIDFTFAIGSQTYRIHRQPAQRRPKLRGEGFTDDVANATLWQVNNDSGLSAADDESNMTLLASRKIKDVTKRVEQIIGLQADQFRQVVVLPQGKFRELLTAEATQREEIFAQLFQTHRYLRIEEHLKDAARDVRQQMRQHEQNLTTIFAEAQVENEQQLAEQLEQLTSSVESLATQRNELAATLQQHRSKQQQAQQLEQQFQQQAQHRQKQHQLDNQRADILAKQTRLQQARNAQAVSAFVHKQQWLNDELQRVKTLLEQAQQTHEQRLKDNAEAEHQYQQNEQLESKNAELQQRIEQLSRWLPKLDTLKQLKQQLDALARSLANQQRSQQHYRDERETLKQQLATQTTQLQAIKSAIAKHSNIEVRRNQLAAERQRTQREQQLTDKANTQIAAINQLESELSQQQARTQTAEAQSKKVEQQWYQQQALSLAGTLKNNHPCPVCGSREHPAPARADTHGSIDHQQLVQARENYQTHVQHQQKIEQQLMQQRHAHDVIVEQRRELGETIDLPSIEQQQAELEATDLQQRQHIAQQQTLEQSIAQYQQQFDHIGERLNALAEQSHQLQLEQATCQQKLTALEQDIPATYRSAETVAQSLQQLNDALEQNKAVQRQIVERRQAAMQNLAAAEAKLTDLRQRHQDVARQLQEANQTLDEQLAAHQLPSIAQYKDALLPDDTYQAYEQQIRDFEQQVTWVKRALDELDDTLKDKTQPDLPNIQRELEHIEQSHEDAHARWLSARDQLLALETILGRVKNSKKQAQKLHKRYAVLGTLADVASGQNAQRLSLHRFVLSVLLDDVLSVASQRLEKMTHGRYQLLRESQVSDARSAGGLTILVEDAYTGQQRSTKTLSGGEGFMAALALALGLSDVVQNYAGGIRLDTLFVDEGFGSLDDEALDMAIDTLAELRASGRTIGIISHVRELQDRLTDRIDVIRERNGSRIEMRTQ